MTLDVDQSAYTELEIRSVGVYKLDDIHLLYIMCSGNHGKFVMLEKLVQLYGEQKEPVSASRLGFPAAVALQPSLN